MDLSEILQKLQGEIMAFAKQNATDGSEAYHQVIVAIADEMDAWAEGSRLMICDSDEDI